MKKFLLSYVTILLFCTTLSAAEDVMCLAVVEKNGEETYFALGKLPIITHGKGTVTITGVDYTIEDLSLNYVEKLYHTRAVPTGIGSIAAMDGASADFANGKVLFTGLKDGVRVYVYTVDGQMVGSATASEDGNVCIDLNSLKGNQVYILRTPSTSYKIVK